MDVANEGPVRPNRPARPAHPTRARLGPRAGYAGIGDEITLLALGTVILRRRWLILRLMIVTSLLFGAVAFSRPRQYIASASFAPVAGDPGRSGLASLAGQFGIALPTGNQSLSPEFYASLLASRSLLLPIVRDSVSVGELGGRRVSLLDLWEIKDNPDAPGAREDRGVERLRKVIEVTTVKTTGVVTFSVSTRWRSVSLAIANALVSGVDLFNQRSRQGQGAAERRFVERRLAEARLQLRDAEERRRQFLDRNRMIGASPELALERDRIERDLSLRQQVYTSLTQAFEEARVREVRDTPVITIVEPPAVPAEPRGRGTLKFLGLGAVLGGVVALVLALMSDAAQRRREEAEAALFADALKDAKRDVLRPMSWVGLSRRS